MNKICVLGSINMDMVMGVDNIPKKGETVLANGLEYYPGGKGANQAVAAKRIGTDVTMLGSVGEDEHGKIMLDSLYEEGINIDHIREVEDSTGLAVINVDKMGENNIVVLQGANNHIDVDYVVENRRIIGDSDILICQLEIPMDAVEEAFKIARNNKTITILNPAPAREISDSLLKLTDIIIPNETEMEIITGIYPETEEDMISASKLLLYKGVGNIIITLGDKGSFFMNGDDFKRIEAYDVKAVDTTAAGDSFVGAFAARLASLDFLDIFYAIKIGTKAAAVTVQNKGAQASLPYLRDIKF